MTKQDRNAHSHCAIAFGPANFASPYWTLRQLRAAATTGDPDAIEKHVDFPSLRESLKAEFQAKIVAPMLNDPQELRN